MKKIILIFSIIFGWICFLFSEDYSWFSIHAGSNSSESKVKFYIENSKKQKTGILPNLKENNDLPNCSYDSNRLGDYENGPDETDHESIEFGCNSVMSDTYTIVFHSMYDSKFWYSIRLCDALGIFENSKFYEFEEYINSNSTKQVSFFFDPTPGAPPPVLAKIVTFQTLRDDFDVAYKLNQIGDEKFVNSLIRKVNIAEKLSQKCEKLKDKNDKSRLKCYKPAIAILRLIAKRLEAINKLCDSKTECKPKCKQKQECDEDEVFKEFDNKYRKDTDFKDFFSEWDKEEYHKHKKTCKRYITDEALEIIATDINWLIKSFGEEVWNDYKKEHNPYIPEKYKQFFK